jgi:hypothetical protein
MGLQNQCSHYFERGLNGFFAKSETENRVETLVGRCSPKLAGRDFAFIEHQNAFVAISCPYSRCRAGCGR